MHHGVRITDDSLIAAARLSDRYVGGRFLPDKAIDLMDEAGSRLRIEIDSLPQEIDEVERKIIQLEIEKQVLAREDDRGARERLGGIEAELSELRESSQSMKARWQAEKIRIARIQELKERVDRLRTEADQATRGGELARAAEIQYSEIPGAQGDMVRGRLKEHFRPEFLNRVDDVVVFKPLSRGELEQIVELQLNRVVKLAAGQDVVLEVSDRAKEVIARVGYDPAFGARPLKRAVQRLVQDPLAMAILDGGVVPGSVVRVEKGEDGDALVFVGVGEG